MQKLLTAASLAISLVASAVALDEVPNLCTPTIVAGGSISSLQFQVQPGLFATEYTRVATVRCAGKMADEDCTFCGIWDLDWSPNGLNWFDANNHLWPANQISKEKNLSCTKTLVDVDLQWSINVTPDMMSDGVYVLIHALYRGSCSSPLVPSVTRSVIFTVT